MEVIKTTARLIKIPFNHLYELNLKNIIPKYNTLVFNKIILKRIYIHKYVYIRALTSNVFRVNSRKSSERGAR